MKCNEFEEILPDYLTETGDARQRSMAEKHMADCADCRESYAIWKKLAQLPEEQPSPAMRTRFETMLNAYEEGRWEHSKLKQQHRAVTPGGFFGDWLRMPAMQLAGAAAMLMIGILIGRMFLPGQTTTPESRELAALHQELTSTKQLVVLSMLQQQSASERLQGVSYSMQVNHPDPEIVAALLHTLRHDTSVDVRLAALDSLRRYNNEPRVRKGLVDSLQVQQSPMVQIALIDMMVEMREKSALPNIKKFEESPNLNPTVKQRAQQGIEKLSRG
jgi:hypothetical protein